MKEVLWFWNDIKNLRQVFKEGKGSVKNPSQTTSFQTPISFFNTFFLENSRNLSNAIIQTFTPQ